MKRLIVLLGIVVLNFLFASVLYASVAQASNGWTTVGITAYSPTHDKTLTGCSNKYVNGERVCYTACPAPHNILHDKEFTVAANPRMGLKCGDKVRFLKWANGRFYAHNALVTDTTACTLWFCDFEFSYSLALATGQPPRAWDNPRHISWQRGWASQGRRGASDGLGASQSGSTYPEFMDSLRSPLNVSQTYRGRSAKYWHHAWKGERKVRVRRGNLINAQRRVIYGLNRKPRNYDARYAIHLAALTYGVNEGDMLRVASCESGFNTYSVNSSSTASGLFQFLNSTWRTNLYSGFSVFDPVANALGAAWLVRQDGGWREWQCRP